MTSPSTSAQIPSITAGPRQSNFELLRIFAMILVLVVHADFLPLGNPGYEDFETNPINAFTRTFIESLALVCVNVFVLISGWFGIKSSLKGFCSFIFQCIYFQFGLYIAAVLTGISPLKISGIVDCFIPNWFILAYIGLYLCAPIINKFIEKSSKKEIEIFLIGFYCLQTVYGFTGFAEFFNQGCSPFSFIGLYILAKYIKVYWADKLSSWGLAIYLLCAILNSAGFYIKSLLPRFFDLTSYINPLVILGSVGLLLFFNGLNLKFNKTINWIAKSAFAAFLLHFNTNIFLPLYVPTVRDLYASFSGIGCVSVIFLFIIIVFGCAVLLDQPRRWLWGLIAGKIEPFGYWGVKIKEKK